jgi:hypothetical protein
MTTRINKRFPANVFAGVRESMGQFFQKAPPGRAVFEAKEGDKK